MITLFVWNWLASFSEDSFKEYIQSFGAYGWVVFVILQFLQVFIALIPGELLETAAGFAFGPWVGTLLCYIGVTVASSLVFVLTKKYGVKLVELFFPVEKINELKFINTETKRNNLIFLLFFMPGTPKDLITYFVGLTDMKLGVFLAITLVARIPSVISSTFGGFLIGEGDYLSAILVYGITGIVSLVCLFFYNRLIKKKN